MSVVLPVYNGERYLQEAIESVLRQDYRAVELLVVDDGSEDGSAALAGRYRGAGVRVLSQENAGTAAARNAGIAAAGGQLIAHLDADDVWTDSRLGRQVHLLLADRTAGAVCGLVEEFVSPDLGHAGRRTLRAPRPPVQAYSLGAMLVRRSAQDRVGPFGTLWRAGQDLDWLLRAKELGIRIVDDPEIALRRRLHARNKGRARSELGSDRCRILKESLDRRRAAAAAEQ